MKTLSLTLVTILAFAACGPEDQLPGPGPEPTPTTISASQACQAVGNALCARLSACGLTSATCAPGGVAYACLRDVPTGAGSVLQSTVNTCTAAIGVAACTSLTYVPTACASVP